MRDRTAYYSEVAEENQRKVLTLQQDGDKIYVICLDKRSFDSDKDEVAGYVHRKDGKYSGREYATLIMGCLPGCLSSGDASDPARVGGGTSMLQPLLSASM